MAMIETSDRGVTLTKSLAWTIVVGLITGALGAGWILSDMSTQITALRGESSIAINSRADLDVRLRALETGAARQEVQWSTLTSSMEELKSEQRENNRLLRALIQRTEP